MIIAGNDSVNSLSGALASNDVLYGYGGTDVLLALYGNDTAYGGTGNDTIYAYDGRDVLSGGAGSDDFRFFHNFSFFTKPTVAYITDFQPGIDDIDLRDIRTYRPVVDSNGDGRFGRGDSAYRVIDNHLAIDAGPVDIVFGNLSPTASLAMSDFILS